MDKKALFTTAHKIAKQTVAIVGDYRIALSLALKGLWAQMKETVKTAADYAMDLAKAQYERINTKKYNGNSLNPEYKDACRRIVEIEKSFKAAAAAEGRRCLGLRNAAFKAVFGEDRASMSLWDTSDAIGYIF